MSVQVLMALVDINLFKQMSQGEIDEVTTALVQEIESDPALKRRLADAVAPSAQFILSRKAMKGS